MKMLRFTFLIKMLFLLILISSCVSKRETIKTDTKDSTNVSVEAVRVEYKYIETIDTVTIPADSSWLELLYECDSMGQIRLKEITDLQIGLRSKPRVVIKDNIIRIDCYCDSAEFHTVQTELVQLRDSITDSKIVVVSESTWYEKVVKWRIPAWLWIPALLVVAFFVIRTVMKLKI